jgi:cation diffusion facilitator CzcD-associated flavoprotein CzcO
MHARTTQHDPKAPTVTEYLVVVIGASPSGIAAALSLRDRAVGADRLAARSGKCGRCA